MSVMMAAGAVTQNINQNYIGKLGFREMAGVASGTNYLALWSDVVRGGLMPLTTCTLVAQAATAEPTQLQAGQWIQLTFMLLTTFGIFVGVGIFLTAEGVSSWTSNDPKVIWNTANATKTFVVTTVVGWCWLGFAFFLNGIDMVLVPVVNTLLRSFVISHYCNCQTSEL